MFCTVALATTLASLAGCREESASREGSGVAKTESRALSAFADVELRGFASVSFETAPAPSLTLTADDNLLSLVTTRVVGTKLVIQTPENARPKTRIEVRVAGPAVRSISVEGGGHVRAQELHHEQLSVQISGAGLVDLAGQVERLDLRVTGSAAVAAAGLNASDVTVTLLGTGRADVAASSTLSVDLDGIGTVRYRGSPRVMKHISGLGRVEPM